MHNLSTLFLAPKVMTGLIQVGISSLLVFATVLLAYWGRIAIGKETAVSMVRGFVQIIVVGVVLIIIMNTTIILGYVALAFMIVFAALLSRRRAQGLPNATRISLTSIAIGSGVTVLIMIVTHVIGPKIAMMIPVGSMVIASAMRTNSLTLNRFRAEIEANVGQIEAGLSLGAPPSTVIERYVTNTVHASIIPVVDTLRSLGIVFIPGMASGMLLAGANPIYAAEYQFATIAMLFAASTLTSLIAGLMLRTTIFSSAEQLILRPQAKLQK